MLQHLLHRLLQHTQQQRVGDSFAHACTLVEPDLPSATSTDPLMPACMHMRHMQNAHDDKRPGCWEVRQSVCVAWTLTELLVQVGGRGGEDLHAPALSSGPDAGPADGRGSRGAHRMRDATSGCMPIYAPAACAKRTACMPFGRRAAAQFTDDPAVHDASKSNIPGSAEAPGTSAGGGAAHHGGLHRGCVESNNECFGPGKQSQGPHSKN